ncbi:hypothetical protein EVAR_8139_1 [Eumeta japonica]|uniref:Uncharacterized protein n=1 Tax=Eumeta variegata TaxID=151549 RepID=A0A4C1TST9_EUMVA|nr:hypothetical protein EVAR_8139_1 [Eumeta japonica]
MLWWTISRYGYSFLLPSYSFWLLRSFHSIPSTPLPSFHSTTPSHSGCPLPCYCPLGYCCPARSGYCPFRLLPVLATARSGYCPLPLRICNQQPHR